MTSRSSFSEFSAITRNRLSRSAWLVTLWSVILFLFIPVAQALIVSQSGLLSEETQSAVRTVNAMFDPKQNWIILLTAMMGVLSAASMFAFADSPRQCDFYMSQPVSRDGLFLSNWLNGFIIFAVPMAAAILLAAAVTCISGCSRYLDFWMVFEGIGYQLLVFLVVYDFTIFWCVVCGNIVITLLCTAYSMVILSGAWLELLYYKNRFFDTFAASQLNLETAAALCPLAPFLMLRAETSYIGDWWVLIAIWSAAALALGAAAMALFRRRPAEKAGRPLAFPKALPFVKYPLTACAAVVGGIVFREMTRSTGWEVFGYLLFGTVAFLLINVLEKFDFKNITKNLGKLGILALALALLITAAATDVFGYDRRLPSRGSVTAVRSYTLNGDFGDGYAEYSNSDCDIRDTGIIDLLYALSKEAVKQEAVKQEADSGTGDAAVFAVDYQTLTGRFIRRYSVTANDTTRNLASQLCSEKEFVKTGLSVWQFEADDVESISFIPSCMDYDGNDWYSSNTDVYDSHSGNSLVKPDQLLEALRADMTDKSVADAKGGSDYLGTVEISGRKGNYFYYDIPIYSCYAATMATRMGQIAAAEDIPSVDGTPSVVIRKFDGEYGTAASESDKYLSARVSDTEQIKELLSVCAFDSGYCQTCEKREPGYEVLLYNSSGDVSVYCGIKAGRLPDFVAGLLENS